MPITLQPLKGAILVPASSNIPKEIFVYGVPEVISEFVAENIAEDAAPFENISFLVSGTVFSLSGFWRLFFVIKLPSMPLSAPTIFLILPSEVV